MVWWLEEADFNATLRRLYQPTPSQRAVFQPDFLCFLAMALHQLKFIADEYPEVEKLNFQVERNGRTTRYMEGFHGSMASGLEAIGHPELVSLLGEFQPVTKEVIPCQAKGLRPTRLYFPPRPGP
jgi:hypothetical protein